MDNQDAAGFLSAVGSSFGDLALSVGDDGQLLAESTAEQMVGPFPFCVTFLGRESFTLKLWAPSPEDAARTVSGMIAAANKSMPGWGAFAGACPSGV